MRSEEQSRAARRLAERKSGKNARRVPGWVVPIVAAGSGLVFAGWLGALFGAVVGTIVWKSR